MKTVKFLKMGIELELNGEQLNHRFRGCVKNKHNEVLFIEICPFEISKYSSDALKTKFGVGTYTFHISHVFRIEFQESNHDLKYSKFETTTETTATFKNITDFINKSFDCDYDNFELIDWMDGKYNYDEIMKELKGA